MSSCATAHPRFSPGVSSWSQSAVETKPVSVRVESQGVKKKKQQGEKKTVKHHTSVIRVIISCLLCSCTICFLPSTSSIFILSSSSASVCHYCCASSERSQSVRQTEERPQPDSAMLYWALMLSLTRNKLPQDSVPGCSQASSSCKAWWSLRPDRLHYPITFTNT